MEKGKTSFRQCTQNNMDTFREKPKTLLLTSLVWIQKFLIKAWLEIFERDIIFKCIKTFFLSALQILCIFLRLSKNFHQFKLIFETKKFGKQCSRINSLLIILVWVNNILINTLQVLFFNYFVSNFIINFSLLWAYRRCFKRTFKKRR